MIDAFGRTAAMVDQGGWVAWVLVAMSVLALGIVLAKLSQQLGVSAGSAQAARGLAAWRAGLGEAARMIAGCTHPAGVALATVIEGQRRGLPEALVREEAARRAEAALDEMRAFLRPLEVIASLAPLLGLFGTVLGMIDAFAALEAAGTQVDPAILSGGIWVALLTTAIGLAVAMPSVAALALFERTVERAERQVDDTLAAAFTGALAEAPQREAVHALRRFASA